MKIVKPSLLKKGDTIGIIAPASPPELKKIHYAKTFYEKKGLKVKLAPSVGKRNGYLGGSDQERIADLEFMFKDQTIKGIFCACGGYGTPRIVDQIDYQLIKENPKIFWGYSDITCLHTAIFQRTGLITFHGPMLSSDLAVDELDAVTINGLNQVFAKTEIMINQSTQPLHTLMQGTANGPIVGGNLTLLTSLLGTPYEIDTNGSLLFIEEIEEEPYRIDRMLNQLRLAGKLDQAAGFVIGHFNQCEPKTPAKSLTLEQVIQRYLVIEGKPSVSGFQIGHCLPVKSIPLGARATLDADCKRLMIESGVKE
ncbi:muramoyltetrapeptide carboxypeptidase [Alkalihalobacillus xiaoxiensis]|uniref:Muramoyltetrapeptide carboxypeptidase n=1 Tax=Shouchella xiaoxiensis TaxID=766895 RepID=A0ABS2ST11_9BACI|nr:LD-carboxypeptidase [Shouchella xiaoxiensis]MBM7838668.1 muramoyltetrapeptide carboxypeptidase [Shouchella xiaoxiensis]